MIVDISMKDLVLFSKALSDPNRVRVLAALQVGELCVCEVGDALMLPQSSLSSHLQTLRMSGLVRVAKKGTWAYYALEEGMESILDHLETHFGWSRDPQIQIDRERLQARLDMRECGCCVVGYGQLIQLGGIRK